MLDVKQQLIIHPLTVVRSGQLTQNIDQASLNRQTTLFIGLNNCFLYKDKDPSAIYRSGKYYIVVGNTITMTQAIKDHIFYEIDAPQLAPTAPRSVRLHIKFYLEISKSDVSFYLAEIENVADIIKRVNEISPSYDKSRGLIRLGL